MVPHHSSKLYLFVLLLFISVSSSAQYNFSVLDKVLESKKWVLGRDVSMLVFKDDKLVYERNLGKYDKNTIEPIASCSKWFTAALAMTFVEEGKLSLDHKVSRWLPNLTRANEVSVRQLLSHTSGYQDDWPQDYVPAFMLRDATAEDDDRPLLTIRPTEFVRPEPLELKW